jgi:hypothetical protein
MWMANHGNGTCSNPLFYDEFTDPDVIRVGPDFYLSLTTYRHLRADFHTGGLWADRPGAEPSVPEGVRFDWGEIGRIGRTMQSPMNPPPPIGT